MAADLVVVAKVGSAVEIVAAVAAEAMEIMVAEEEEVNFKRIIPEHIPTKRKGADRRPFFETTSHMLMYEVLL